MQNIFSICLFIASKKWEKFTDYYKCISVQCCQPKRLNFCIFPEKFRRTKGEDNKYVLFNSVKFPHTRVTAEKVKPNSLSQKLYVQIDRT